MGISSSKRFFRPVIRVSQFQLTLLSALLDGEISILVAFATKIVKQHPWGAKRGAIGVGEAEGARSL